MTSKGHALSRDALVRTLTAYSGITTADGAENGTTLVDSNLKDNPYISASGIPEKAILIMSGDARGEDKGAESFDGTDTITLQGTGFSATIKAGTIYRILNISSVEIDVARIETKIDTIDGLVDSIIADYLAHDDYGLANLMVLINSCGAGILTLQGWVGSIIDDYLNHGEHGLDALEALINACGGTLLTLDGRTGSMIDDYLNHGVHGLSKIVDLINACGGGIATIDAIVDAIKVVTDAIPDAGALTALLADIADMKADLEAVLDLAGGASETLLMNGTEQDLYKEEAGTTILFFGGINIDWTGLHAGGGEDTTIRAYRKYGTDWRKFYEETFLAATVPDPPVTPVPRNTDTQCVALPIYYKQGIKITAQQAAAGAGYNTLTFDKVTAAPEA